ncbi:hypothetical protein OIU84_025399 [Salix udensis]|uniref:Uncharacterized protein n=1 Tax=Salix udensis TaxID=889485 RepID=A0AAD6KLQ8_9ROSI|nr:hypothetical protein OIU84_025399 [Salix udensis]
MGSENQVLGQEFYAWSEIYIVVRMRQLMGLRKELACVAVLFFILLLVETSSLPYRSARYGSSKNKGSSSQLMGPVKSRGGGLRGDEDEGGDATLADEKRKIYTGPNPLHNR